MPTLEISDGNGRLVFEAGVITTATVIYPREKDAAKRTAWIAAYRALLASLEHEISPEVVVSEDSSYQVNQLRHLVDALYRNLCLSPRQTIQNGLNRLPGSQRAAEILLSRLRAEKHERHGTMERAIHLTSKLYAATYPDEAASIGNLKKSWIHYRAATHLGFALTVLKNDLGGEMLFHDPRENEELVLGALSLAESSRLEAEAAEILNPAETWKAPPDLVLPPISFEFQSLSEVDLEILDEDFQRRLLC